MKKTTITLLLLAMTTAGVQTAFAQTDSRDYERGWCSQGDRPPVSSAMLRPFAIGICILLFPSLVLGTMNSVMSPIVQGVSTMLEGQKLDLEELRQQKDELEAEMMKRTPKGQNNRCPNIGLPTFGQR